MIAPELEMFKADEEFRKLKMVVARAIEGGWRVDQVERELFASLLALGLELLKVFLMAFGKGDVGETVEHQGRTLRRLAEPHSRRYLSVFGAVLLCRFVYGTREGQKIEHVPMDAQLGLPTGEISYVLNDWLQRMCLKDAFGEAVESLRALLNLKMSVNTAEEQNRAMADYTPSFRVAQDVPPAEEEAELLVFTADGKGVPMRRTESVADAESVAKNSPAEATSNRRRGKGEKANKKQMAYVGAAYSIDRFPRTVEEIIDEVIRKERVKDRPKPQHKHVWAEMTRHGDPSDPGTVTDGRGFLFAELAVECLRRDAHQTKVWICLLDGEASLWAEKEAWLKRAVGVLDLFHVMERLWTVAHCFHAEQTPEAEAFVTRYLTLLLEGRVDTVIRSFRSLAPTLKGEKRKRVQAAITYYANNREHMRYDEYIAAGYPIGSGVAEGACRHVVKDRMERTGMRWTLPGAQSLLRLRAIYINGDWDAFVDHQIRCQQETLYGVAA